MTIMASGVLAEGKKEGSDLLPRAQIVKPDQFTVDPERHFSHVISIKFRDGLHVRLRDRVLTDEGTGALHQAGTVLESVAGGEWRRAYDLPEQKISQLQEKAQASLNRVVADLNLQFNLFLPDGADPGAVIDRFNALNCVELALPCPRPTPLPVPPDFQPNQVYEDAATPGIGAESIWTIPGVTGSGIRIADVEYSWNLNHSDLPVTTLLGFTPVDPFNDNNHGTAVLGEVGGKNNGWGVTGIAPDAQLFVAGTFNGTVWDVGNAILTALSVLGPGDVIIIEQQTSGPNAEGNGQFGLVPVEWWPPWYNTIVVAVGNGVTVVEAAGNGSQDLDDQDYSTDNFGHWPFLPANDSGAIIVGAGAAASGWGSTVDRSRLSFSCYGSTVDLQGWGESVWTTGYGDTWSSEGADLFYTGFFGGTSSASPIVAGACALLQAAALAETGQVLTPAEVRQILRDTGSPQQSGFFPATQNIGPFPDVEAAIDVIVGLPPANDECTSGVGVPAGATTLDTVAATASGLSEICGSFDADVWFFHIVQCTGTLTVSVCDANFDTRLSVYGFACPAVPGEALACSDNDCGITGSEITIPVVPGFYRIRVGGAPGQAGTGTLNIVCTPTPVCIGDIAPAGGNGTVNIDDLVAVLNAFGPCPAPPELCLADITPSGGNGVVNIDDLVAVLNAFGACP